METKSESNVKICAQANLVPLIAVARQDHHPHWRERFTEPAPLQGKRPVNPS